MKKRLSCLFLVLVLCLTLPVTAFASENGSNENFEFIPMTMEEYNTYTRIPFVIGTTYKVPNR